jgi:hypothetical protein
MTRLLRILFGLTILAAPVVVSAHHHLKHDFYVYDTSSRDFIYGAVVTVTYETGSQEGETGSPHGNVQFRLPGEFEFVQVRVEAVGYEPFDGTIRLGFRPHVGGKGIWIGLDPASALR